MQILARPAGERVDLQARSLLFEDREVFPAAAVNSLAPGNPALDAGQRIFQGDDFSQVAAVVRVARPKGSVPVGGRDLVGVWRDNPNVLEAQEIDQLVAVGEGFRKMFAGVDEIDRQCGIDLSDQVQEDRRFGAERGDESGAAGVELAMDESDDLRGGESAKARFEQGSAGLFFDNRHS